MDNYNEEYDEEFYHYQYMVAMNRAYWEEEEAKLFLNKKFKRFYGSKQRFSNRKFKSIGNAVISQDGFEYDLPF